MKKYIIIGMVIFLLIIGFTIYYERPINYIDVDKEFLNLDENLSNDELEKKGYVNVTDVLSHEKGFNLLQEFGRYRFRVKTFYVEDGKRHLTIYWKNMNSPEIFMQRHILDGHSMYDKENTAMFNKPEIKKKNDVIEVYYRKDIGTPDFIDRYKLMFSYYKDNRQEIKGSF